MSNKHLEELNRMVITDEHLSDEQKERFMRFNAAQEVLRETVNEMGIQDISEFSGDLLDKHWYVVKYETPRTVQLLIKVSSEFGFFYANFIGMNTAEYFMAQVENVLSQPGADKIFNIDTNDKEAVANAVRFNTKMLLQNFIDFLPMKFYHASVQALDDATSSYIRRVVEPVFKAHWESLGLSHEFALIPERELKKRDKEMEDLRKMLVGLKKPAITDEIKAELPKHHEKLRKDYQSAREYYDTSRELFFRSRRNANNEEWRDKWWDIGKEMFPQLRYECLEKIAEGGYSPHELSFDHLGLFYSLDPEYVKRLTYGKKTRQQTKND